PCLCARFHSASSSLCSSFSLHATAAHPALHSFPTRRSSDLGSARLGRDDERDARGDPEGLPPLALPQPLRHRRRPLRRSRDRGQDRKSTRLNSSHGSISYAVFCLKKKNKTRNRTEYCTQKKG